MRVAAEVSPPMETLTKLFLPLGTPELTSTPGRSRASSSALRPLSGRAVICWRETIPSTLCSVGFTCTISPSTVMSCFSAPTSRLKFTINTRPTNSSACLAVVRKPGAVARTS